MRSIWLLKEKPTSKTHPSEQEDAMGIGDLWESLKSGFEERVTLDKFVADFIDENQRPPRVAIDAYVFMFMPTVVGVEDDIMYPVRGFMSKVFALISLNMPLIVVFDGRYKPNKLRNNEREFEASYEFTIDIFKNSDVTSYSENIPVINKVKELLIQHKIDFLQAPGEAEAQCAWLQKFGIVDYVISNDSDCLVFGATKILRNFNRYEPDILASPKKLQIKPKGKYYVTPVHLSKIESIYGLDTKRLIFLAALRGGDYSSGSNGVGILYATKLALCGTTYIKNQKLSKVAMKELKILRNDKNLFELPDFASLAMNCFISPNCQHLLQANIPILNKDERERKLRVVVDLLNKTIHTKSRLIFNRLFSGNLTIDGELVLLYLFPIVCSAIYKFLPCSLSGDENITCDLHIPQEYRNRIPIAGSDQITRINNILPSNNDDIVGYLHLEYENVNCKLKIKHQVLMVERGVNLAQEYTIPLHFDFYIKYMIIKILNKKYSTLESIKDTFYISKLKDDDGTQFAMIKYNAKELYARYPSCIENSRKDADITVSLANYVWLPLNLVKLVNPTFVKDYEQELERSLNVKPNQNITLDMFEVFHKSPVKFTGCFDESELKSSCKTVIKSPTKSSRSVTKRKRSLLPGQSLLDSFIGLNKNLEIPSDIDDESPKKKLKIKSNDHAKPKLPKLEANHNFNNFTSQYGPPVKFDLDLVNRNQDLVSAQKDIICINTDSSSEENDSDIVLLSHDPFEVQHPTLDKTCKSNNLNSQKAELEVLQDVFGG